MLSEVESAAVKDGKEKAIERQGEFSTHRYAHIHLSFSIKKKKARRKKSCHSGDQPHVPQGQTVGCSYPCGDIWLVSTKIHDMAKRMWTPDHYTQM